MQDQKGSVLNIGDTVLFTEYDRCSEIYKGKVKAFTPKMVKVETNGRTSNRAPHTLYKVEPVSD